MKHYNIPIFIPHLGCPYDCIYCNQRTIAAQQEIPSIAQVVATVEQHLQTIPQGAHVEVAFFGGSFTAVDQCMQEEYLRAVQPYLSGGRVHSIRISTRPDRIDNDVLDLLAEYGVKTIELGVQSLSERVLQAASRRYTPETVGRSCQLIHARKFELGIQLMIGLPQDSYTLDLETTRQVIELRPAVVRIYPTLVIAGTVLESMWSSGDYKPLGLDEAVKTCRDMALMLQRENIRIIRMGLYPGEELLREGVVRAGPFHPSFGELVEQSIFKAQAHLAINRLKLETPQFTEIELHVNNRDLSKMIGQHKSNLHDLQREFGLRAIRIKTETDLERGGLRIYAGSGEGAGLLISRDEFLGWHQKS